MIRYSYARNCPLKYTDPTGQMISPYYDENGTFLGLDEKGWKGKIYITDQATFDKYKTGDGQVSSSILKDQNSPKLISSFGGLSDEALANIYTSILAETGYAERSKLHNGSILHISEHTHPLIQPKTV